MLTSVCYQYWISQGEELEVLKPEKWMLSAAVAWVINEWMASPSSDGENAAQFKSLCYLIHVGGSGTGFDPIKY